MDSILYGNSKQPINQRAGLGDFVETVPDCKHRVGIIDKPSSKHLSNTIELMLGVLYHGKDNINNNIINYY